MIENLWQKPITPLQLTEHEVHIWRAQLNISPEARSRFQRILSPEENAKAQRFYFERDRQYWMVAHSILRMLLSLYTQQAPQEITFQVNAYGKPSLPTIDHQPLLQFRDSQKLNYPRSPLSKG